MESEPATAVVAAGELGATEVAVGTADAVVVGGLSPLDGLSPVSDEDRSEDLVDDKDGPGGLVDDKDGHASEAAAHLEMDAVIDPASTRGIILKAFKSFGA